MKRQSPHRPRTTAASPTFGLRLGAIIALALMVGTAACSSPSGEAADGGDQGCGAAFCAVDAPESDAPIELQVKDTIDFVCAGVDCHGVGAGGMSVSVGNEFSDMVNVPSKENSPMLRVKPFDPANSYVYIKLACQPFTIPVGACMPGGNASPRYANMFKEWIEAGAPTQ
jgi:hypothetical protein